MMTNLFSSFDPSTNSLISLNWASMMIFLIFLGSKFWVSDSKASKVINLILQTLFNETKVIIPNSMFFSIMLIAIFMFILINNFMGLFPYIFTGTSHMAISLAVAFPLWLGLMLFGWIKHNKHMFAHLVPQSTPGVLMPFMVLIESTSNIIRPLTLAIRLSANMIAGHLLMTLLGNQLAATADSPALVGVMLAQLALSTLEMAVSMIQAYVFFILLTLYLGEIENH
uniref:ATP synthase subunit a n=1 Tax=Sminthurides bifidus TaxID=2584528 RepID=A0A6H0EXY6_9HEXA|nr:ATP synthase F0 subunit 6 [Sminthurides bifidus]